MIDERESHKSPNPIIFKSWSSFFEHLKYKYSRLINCFLSMTVVYKNNEYKNHVT